LIDAQERAVLRANVFMQHAMLSAKESVHSLCKDDILKIRAPYGLFPSFAVTSFRDDFHRGSES
jgi:hypothetical protein